MDARNTNEKHIYAHVVCVCVWSSTHFPTFARAQTENVSGMINDAHSVRHGIITDMS